MTNQEAKEKLEEMKEYLNLEVPHYLEDEVKEVEPAGRFDFLLTEGINAEVDVYEVELQSGRKVFAAEGGWNRNRLINVYGEKIPDAETAAKIHIYTIALVAEGNEPELKGAANALADHIELPQRFRDVALFAL